MLKFHQLLLGGIAVTILLVDKTGASTNTALGAWATSNEGKIEMFMPDITDATANTERTFQISVSNAGSGNKFYVDGVLEIAIMLLSLKKVKHISLTNQTQQTLDTR